MSYQNPNVMLQYPQASYTNQVCFRARFTLKLTNGYLQPRRQPHDVLRHQPRLEVDHLNTDVAFRLQPGEYYHPRIAPAHGLGHYAYPPAPSVAFTTVNAPSITINNYNYRREPSVQEEENEGSSEARRSGLERWVRITKDVLTLFFSGLSLCLGG